MKQQLKILRSIKQLRIFVLLSSIVFSCTKDKSYGTLYFFEQKDRSTIISLTCDEIFDSKGLKKVEIIDKELYELLILSKKEVFPIDNSNIDVRYKIEIDSDVLCLAYPGDFILNNKYQGSFHFINKIEKYISDNKDISIAITEQTPKPWDNN